MGELHWLDIVVIVAFFLIIFGIAAYYSKQAGKDTGEFFFPVEICPGILLEQQWLQQHLLPIHLLAVTELNCTKWNCRKLALVEFSNWRNVNCFLLC